MRRRKSEERRIKKNEKVGKIKSKTELRVRGEEKNRDGADEEKKK